MKITTVQYRDDENGHQIEETWELEADVTPGSPGSWDEPSSSPEVEIEKGVLVDATDTETDADLETGLELDGEAFLARFGLDHDSLDDEILQACADDEQGRYDDACEAACDAWKENGKVGRPRYPRRRPRRW